MRSAESSVLRAVFALKSAVSLVWEVESFVERAEFLVRTDARFFERVSFAILRDADIFCSVVSLPSVSNCML